MCNQNEWENLLDKKKSDISTRVLRIRQNQLIKSNKRIYKIETLSKNKRRVSVKKRKERKSTRERERDDSKEEEEGKICSQHTKKRVK